MHADDPPTVGRDHRVGVAVGSGRGRLGSQRPRVVARPTHRPQPLVLPVGEHQGFVVDGVAAPAVLVHLRAGREAGGNGVDGRVPGAGRHDDLAARVAGATLVPVDAVVGHLHLRDTDGRFDKRARR